MNKLEHYLDQVCRGIAGPRSLRQHIRQELREHLMDAVAEHENAGVTHEAAMDRALEEFGGPDEVRRELEATHGHRLMTVVVDKAMQWKEKTMKAKWLWTTWAHLGLGLVIALGATFIIGAKLGVMPMFRRMNEWGWMSVWNPDPTPARPVVEAWCGSIIDVVMLICDQWTMWAIPLAIVWVLFEWRAKTENKAMIRLAGISTFALATTVAAVLFLAAIALPFFPEMQLMHGQAPEPLVEEHLSAARASISKLDEALAKNDWKTIDQETWQLHTTMFHLGGMGAAAPVIAVMEGRTNIAEVRTKIRSAQQTLQTARLRNKIHDAETLEAAILETRALLSRIPASATTLPAKERAKQ